MLMLYSNLCPNCGGTISSERLEAGLPCDKCLPSAAAKRVRRLRYGERVKRLKSELLRERKLAAFLDVSYLEEQLADFERFCSTVGFSLWSAQRSWAKRLLSGESFAIVAPTGVGKTTLLMLYAVYKVSRGDLVYLVVPTENIAKQTVGRLSSILKKCGLSDELLAYYYSSLSKHEKKVMLGKILKKQFKLLVTTSSFLTRRFDHLQDARFDVIVVDDVDALLKSSKNVDKILMLLGFSDEVIAKAEKLVVTKLNALKLKAVGHPRAGDALKRAASLQAEIASYLESHDVGQLVIASATGRGSSLKAKVFRELLGFEVGGIHDYMRNIVDTYLEVPRGFSGDGGVSSVVRVVRMLGRGGLVFVSKEYGLAAARRIVEALKASGMRARLAVSGYSSLEKFASGEVDVLVGVATYYGVIVRGIDLPKAVRYAVFYGVPKHVIPLEKAVMSHRRLLALLAYLARRGDEASQKYLEDISARLERLTLSELRVLQIALREGEELEGKLGELKSIMAKAADHVVKALSELLQRSGGKLALDTIIIRCRDGRKVCVEIPDAFTYLQASGRTSRMLKGSMTFGLSVVIPEDAGILRALERRLRAFLENFTFKALRDVDVKTLVEMIDSTRSEKVGGRGVRVHTALIIVESPNKARTIAYFFGRPSKRRVYGVTVYEVPIVTEDGATYIAQITSTKGHLFDLTTRVRDGKTRNLHGVELRGSSVVPVYAPIKRCLDCSHQFSSDERICPRCGSAEVLDRSTAISALRKLSLENDLVFIATDPDVEGEKIAWDVYLALKPYNDEIYRVEFHEVTKRAVLEALKRPRKVDKRRVYAQVVRRVEDRWIGFELSQKLWRVFGKRWLGAGRVQTPVLGWIVDRYDKWKRSEKFLLRIKTQEGFELGLYLSDGHEAESVREAVEKRAILRVENIEFRRVQVDPPPPYTTDELLFEASRELGLTSSLTMKLAQNLFEAGLITYHRTDSTRVSSAGINIAKDYIAKKLGAPDSFIPRRWGSEGAHEAIRPTMPLDGHEIAEGIMTGSLRIPIRLTKMHFKLYDMILKRFVASQMKPSVVEEVVMTVEVTEGVHLHLRYPYKLLNDGHLLVYVKDRPDILLKGKELAGKVKLCQVLQTRTMHVVECRVRKVRTVALYTHGDVVKLMKKRGIGRPSTYAQVIQALRRHGYVIESKRRKYLVPTKDGIVVYSWLVSNFSELVSEETTRVLERQMDLIEEGKARPEAVLRGLLAKLLPLIREREPALAAYGLFKEAEEGVAGATV